MATNNGDDVKGKLNEALTLNRNMQHQLLAIRQKLENLLSNVKETYRANEVFLKKGICSKRQTGIGIKGAYLKGGTFYLKGNMFFKDIKCRNCPNNPDYIKRKSENEMFPMDLDLQARHVWSTRDKLAIVVGIKNQIFDYMAQTSRRKFRKRSDIDSEKLAKLLTEVQADFEIDWDYISSQDVQHRHSAKSCEAIWNVFLHPSLKRTSWSEEENNKLIEAVKKYNCQDWQAIALEVGQRSDFQCFVQYQTSVRYALPENTSKWSKEDDERLVRVVEKNTIHGITNWSNVVAHFPHKAKTTLQSRYFYSLNPKINRAPFTPEEDLLLIAAVNEYGTKFNCIPRNLFPNRTVVQLRGRYLNTLSKRHKCEPWTLEDDMLLINFVTEYGVKEWKKCEKALNGKHTRISCRTRFTVIKRYLEKNPEASIESIPRKNNRKNNTINIVNWKDKLEELSTNQKEQNYDDEKEETKVKIPKNVDPPLKLKLEKADKEAKDKKRINQIPSAEMVAAKRKKIAPEKLYISRLRPNGIRNYNFFKYAYNFKLNNYLCDNVQLNSANLSIVMSALNPQISVSLQTCELDTSMPAQLSKSLKTVTPIIPSIRQIQHLPSNWSTAMGFRALCIHTADSDLKNFPSLPVINDTHSHIARFRERLHVLFYSTALLSRLEPSMVGISMPEIDLVATKTIQKTRKRKRSGSKNDSQTAYKNVCNDIISNIKTEFET
ncbi:hypothetical protein DOY81_002939 [Sarcophaga bullata]|nr:hypothetical protein DOY81_002939 [Sarcophaga bullata]